MNKLPTVSRKCAWALATMVAACVITQTPAALADTDGDAQSVDAAIVAENAHRLVKEAQETFVEMVVRPRFQQAIADAKAVIIFPSLLKAGYIVGGESGDGLLLVRDDNGEWSYPAFYQIIGGSFGLQIGVSVSELVLVVRTERALESVLSGNAELGGDLTIALGPASLDTGIDTSADILSFTITQGLFAGASVQGSTLVGAAKRNFAFYGSAVSARDIVLAGLATNPQADDLRDQLVFYVSAIERERQGSAASNN